VSEESSSKCEWEERSKGAAREITARWARLLLHCIPLMGHYLKRWKPGILFNKINKIWFSLQGFSRGVYPEISCAM
jgi:hypothetical protein